MGMFNTVNYNKLWLIGDELADLVDCYTGLMMTQVPSSAFWSGFENLDCE